MCHLLRDDTYSCFSQGCHTKLIPQIMCGNKTANGSL